MIASVWTLDSCELCNAAKVLLVWLPTIAFVMLAMTMLAVILGGDRSKK